MTRGPSTPSAAEILRGMHRRCDRDGYPFPSLGGASCRAPPSHPSFASHQDGCLPRFHGMRSPAATHRVQTGSTVGKRINPNKHTIHLEKLIAHLIGRLFAVNGRFRVDVERCERGEDLMPAIVRRRRLAAGFGSPRQTSASLPTGFDVMRHTEGQLQHHPAREQGSSV